MCITRYKPDADGFGNYHGMKRDEFGDYVLHDEHEQKVLVLSRQEHETANRLDNATARISWLTDEVEKLRDSLQKIVSYADECENADERTAYYFASIARSAMEGF
jgi:hypothetical protein